MTWETIIGLEVHIQLLTQSKIFSGAASNYGAEPNTQACPIDLGLPGVLPVLNKAPVQLAVKFGLAINATVNHHSEFARKNYFYPDLPKGYQITQHLFPIVEHGYLDIELEDLTTKRIAITRAHLEEDAGKSLHESFQGMTGVDLNRAGTALLEIVSAPDMRSAKEASAYLKTLHALVCHLNICDGNLQEGSFRCDVNVSVRPMGSTTLGTRTEIKNLNSFRYVERAIQFESARQIQKLERGESILQETRLYDSDKDETRSMRTKEEAQDYRYFPEPDLLPLHLSEEFIEAIRQTLPELPAQKRERFMQQYQLNHYDANFLTNDPTIGDYFEAAVAAAQCDPKLAANWIMGDLMGALNKASLAFIHSPISSEQLACLLKRIEDQTISGKIAKTVFDSMWHQAGTVDEIIANKGLKQVTDTQSIETIIDSVLAASPSELAAYREGKTKLFGYFVGQVMQASKGKANPQQVNALLTEKLKA